MLDHHGCRWTEKSMKAESRDGLSWLTTVLLLFAFLKFFCKSNGDAAAVVIAFVCLSCLDQVLGFWFKRAAPGSPTRARLKVAVWVLTTLLALVSSYKAVSIMPPVKTARVLFWTAFTILLRGLYAFFFFIMHRYREKDEDDGMYACNHYLSLPAQAYGGEACIVFGTGRMERGHCLGCFKRAATASPTRAQLKVAAWVLTTLVTIVSFKVAAITPVPVQIIVPGVAAAAIVHGGYYAFFAVHMEEKIKADDTVAATFWYKIRSAVTYVVLLPCYLLRFQAALLGPLRMKCHHRLLAMSSRVRTMQSTPGAVGSRARDPLVAWSVPPRLILDSGATRHSVGHRWLLDAFHPYSPPRLASLADGRTTLPILGSGLIESPGFRIPNVDLVEGVQDGLISIPQLDRDHGLVSCFGNRTCRIMVADGTEVGGAILADDDSYVLLYLSVPTGATQMD